MDHSPQINELAAALAKAQSQFTFAKKNKVNPHLKNGYADLSSVLDAVREPLSSNGLSIFQGPMRLENSWVIVTNLVHSSGQYMRSYTPIINMKNDAQGFGSGMTYAKRYGLTAMVGISDGQDDDDGEEACQEPKKNYSNSKNSNILTEDQEEALAIALAECDPETVATIEDFYFKRFNIKSWAQLPPEKYDCVMKNIASRARG